MFCWNQIETDVPMYRMYLHSKKHFVFVLKTVLVKIFVLNF